MIKGLKNKTRYPEPGWRGSRVVSTRGPGRDCRHQEQKFIKKVHELKTFCTAKDAIIPEEEMGKNIFNYYETDIECLENTKEKKSTSPNPPRKALNTKNKNN